MALSIDNRTYGYVTPTDGWTIELWFRRTANPVAAYAPFFSQVSQSSGQHFYLTGRQMICGVETAGQLIVQIIQEDGTPIANWFDPSPAGYGSDGTWHHVALRMADDKKTWTIFLDGEVLYQETMAAAWNISTGVLNVASESASHRGTYNAMYDSRMSYFAVFDKALTNNRIQEHYTAGNGGTVYYGDSETTRIRRVLDWADVPYPSRLVDDSVTTLQGIEVAGSNALDALQETAEAAFGLVFADGQTRVVYRNRSHAYNRFTSITLGETLQSGPDVEFEFSTDNTWVFNDIRGSRPFGGTIRIQDPLSRAKYGRKVYAFSLPITDATELRNAVTWMLARYGIARPRVSSVTFSAINSPLIEVATTGGLQIGDVMTVIDLDVTESPAEVMKFFVEGMSLNADFRGEVWTMTFNLSPYDLNKVFQIGASQLGDGSLVAF